MKMMIKVIIMIIMIMMIDVIVMVDHDDIYTKCHWRLSNDRGDCNGTVNGVWDLASDDEDDDDEEEEDEEDEEDCFFIGMNVIFANCHLRSLIIFN